MIKHRKNKKGFTLIELLVVIAIIAILAVVVVLTLNPAELLRQARDSNRVSDFATLKSAIGLYSADVATSTWLCGGGCSSTSTIFVSGNSSIPATTFTSSSAAGWGFFGGETTGNTSASRLVNGTGWLPINFSVISSGAPIGSLPVDPVNSGNFFYTFVGAQTTYKLAAKMESIKYGYGGSNDVVSTDGGNSTTTYEQGTNITGL